MRVLCQKVEVEVGNSKVTFINPVSRDGNNIKTDMVFTFMFSNQRNIFHYEPGRYYDISIIDEADSKKENHSEKIPLEEIQ